MSMDRVLQVRLTFAALALLLLLGAAGAWGHAALLERRVERALEASALAEPADDAPTSAGLTRAAGNATTATLAAAGATSRTAALTSGTSITTALPATTTTLATAPVTSGTGMTTTTLAGNAASSATTASSATLARQEGRDRRGGRRGGGDRSGERDEAAAEKKPPAFPEALTKLLAQKPVFGKKPAVSAQLQGVLGNQAMINGNWMTAGQQEGPIKVLEIGINKVVVEVDGNRQELTLWSDLPGVSGR